MGRTRHALWLGAAGLLVLAVGMWLAGGTAGPETSTPVTEPEPSTVEPRAAAPEPVPRAEAPRPPPPRPAAPPAAQESPAPQATPEPSSPPVEAVVADPFEPEEGKEPHIRTLVSVGDIQLGVVRESARIRDEAELKAVLVRIGADLEKRVREQPGAAELQQVLDDYREELGKHMDGEVELRGPGWMIGTEVGPPQPREQWWKPREQ